MLRRLLGAALLFIAGCASPPAPGSATQAASYEDSALGIKFDYPMQWQRSQYDQKTVFSGPAGTDAYFTSVTLQGLILPVPLEEALNEEWGEASNLPHFASHYRALSMVGGNLGLGYTVTFDVYDLLREKTGLLFNQRGVTVELAYTAPAGLFALSVPIFQAMLDSLEFTP